MSINTNSFASGDRAHDGRVAGSPASLTGASLGKLTITFFVFWGAGAAAELGAGLTEPGMGLTLRIGPPRTAFGGPPMLN